LYNGADKKALKNKSGLRSFPLFVVGRRISGTVVFAGYGASAKEFKFMTITRIWM